MPKIPRIAPTLNTLTSQPVNAFQRDPGAAGENISTIGRGMAEVGEMFKRANLVAEKTKAQNDLDARLNDIHDRASKDPDTSKEKMQQYDDEIKSSVSDASQLITIPEERSFFNLDAQSKGDIYKNKVGAIFFKKKVNQAKADADIFFSNKKNDFITTLNPAEKQTAMVERDTKIQEMVNAGFLDPDDATTLRFKQTKDWAKSQVEYDIATNPELAKDLLKGKHYPDIDEEDRVQLLSDANSAVNKQRRDAEDGLEINRISNEADYLTRLSTGDLSWMNVADVANDVRAGNVSSKFGLAMTDVIKSQGNYQPDLSAENENYPEFIDNIYKAKDQKELNATLYNILLDHKNISQEKLGVLINGAMQRTKSLSLHGSQVDPKQQEVDSAAMAVTNFGRRSKMSNNQIADIYQNYNKDLQAGKTPKEAYQNAIRTNAITIYPDAATMDNPPNLILNENSPIRVIFPRTGKSSAKGKDGTTKPDNNVSK